MSSSFLRDRDGIRRIAKAARDTGRYGYSSVPKVPWDDIPRILVVDSPGILVVLSTAISPNLQGTGGHRMFTHRSMYTVSVARRPPC